MIVYVESSAVLAWLLREPRNPEVLQTLKVAEQLVSSVITRAECLRNLVRYEATSRLDSDRVCEARGLFRDAVANWTLRDLDDVALDRSGKPFPVEPVRTLDAIHLATALEFHAALGSLTMLSLDERIRANAAALGMEVAP